MMPGIMPSLLSGMPAKLVVELATGQWEPYTQNLHYTDASSDVTGGYPPYTYSWSIVPGTLVAPFNGPGQSFTLGTGRASVVTLTVTDQSGASVTVTGTVAAAP